MDRHRLLYNILWALDHFSYLPRKRQIFKNFRKKVHDKIIEAQSNKDNIKMPLDERHEKFLTRKMLKELPSDRPVVFRGLGKNTVSQNNWGFDFFLNKYGDVQQPFFHRNGDVLDMEVMSVKEGLPNVSTGNPRRSLFGGPFDLMNLYPELQNDMELDKLTDKTFFKRQFTKIWKLFFAGEGQWAWAHSEFGDTLNFVVTGRKRWTLFHPEDAPLFMPDVARHIFVRPTVNANAASLRDGKFGVRYWDIDLEAGDAIFCPNYFWHFIETMEESVSAEYKWASPRMLLQHPFLSSMMLTATRPSVLSQLIQISNPKMMPEPDLFH